MSVLVKINPLAAAYSSLQQLAAAAAYSSIGNNDAEQAPMMWEMAEQLRQDGGCSSPVILRAFSQSIGNNDTEQALMV